MARADAERNYAHIVEIARTVVAEQGTQASLRDIARRAEVGLGTLYRHFPTRDALLEAVLHEGLHRRVERAKQLSASQPPAEALATWIAEMVDGASRYAGLPTSLAAALHDEDSALYATCTQVQAAGARLLKNAQKAGEIRRDITATDLFALIGAVGWTAEQPLAIARRRDYLLSVLIAGLQTSPPASAGASARATRS